MPLETYRLVVGETETADGMTVDLYDEDDLLAASTRVPYEEFGLAVVRDDEPPSAVERETTADVTTVSIDVQRQQGAFEVRVLGDTDERLLTERLDDGDWGLSSAE